MIGRGQKEVHCAVYTKSILFVYKFVLLKFVYKKYILFAGMMIQCFVYFLYTSKCTLFIYFVVCLLC